MSDTQARQTVLVIDDTPDTVKILKRILEFWGYRVLTTNDGEEGLALAEAEAPDLILLDILMPKMKGRDVCARLKANPKTQHTAVIFLTALGLPDHVKAGMDLGADDYLTKPFEPEDLKARIESCLLRKRARTDA